MDIHPQPDHSQVEVRLAGGPIQVGQLDESTLVQRVHATHLALASAVWDGHFVYEDLKTFSFLYHFDTLDDCTSYLAQEWQDAVLDPAIISRARDLLVQGEGEILIREPMWAARLRRV